jgi:hypothetical protein
LKLLFPRLNWIADFRDLPVDDNRKNVYLPKLQWWFIQKLLSKANNITTVSDGLNNVLQKRISDTITLRNGVYNLFDNINVDKYPIFTISYTGSLYPEWQKLDVLFSSIKKLIDEQHINKKDFQIIYAGKDSSIWNTWIKDYKLEKISINKGEISIEESVEIQNKSHINLLLSWSGENLKGILTGKFFEYLATGNPIYLLINGSQDNEFENVFEELNAGFIYYNNDIDNISKRLLLMYNEWLEAGKIDFNYNIDNLKKYSWENRIVILKELI